MKTTKEKSKAVRLVMPKELEELVLASAKKNERSITREVIFRLKKTFDGQDE